MTSPRRRRARTHPSRGRGPIPRARLQRGRAWPSWPVRWGSPNRASITISQSKQALLSEIIEADRQPSDPTRTGGCRVRPAGRGAAGPGSGLSTPWKRYATWTPSPASSRKAATWRPTSWRRTWPSGTGTNSSSDFMIEEGIASGEFADQDSGIAVKAILGMCNSVVRWYRPGGGHTPEEIAAEFAHFAVRGVATARRVPPGSRRNGP